MCQLAPGVLLRLSRAVEKDVPSEDVEVLGTVKELDEGAACDVDSEQEGCSADL